MKFVELGWSGVCVEPSPSVFPALLNLHAKNPNITCVNVAIAAAPGFIEFYDSGGDAVSTTHTPHRDKWHAAFQVPYKRMFVNAATPEQLLARFGYEFDFVNLDVEGVSFDLFCLLPLHKLQHVKVFCVEHDGQIEGIRERLSRYGYHYIWHNNENVIFSK